MDLAVSTGTNGRQPVRDQRVAQCTSLGPYEPPICGSAAGCDAPANGEVQTRSALHGVFRPAVDPTPPTPLPMMTGAMIDNGRSRELTTILHRYRWIILMAVALFTVAVSGLAIVFARHQSNTGSSTGHLVAAASLSHQPFLLFRGTTLNKDYGTMELTSTEHPGAERALTPLKCERVAYAGGRGICLSGTGGSLFSSTRAIVFNSKFKPLFSIPLPGYPSRTQVSRNGEYGATTDFVSGDSYASAGFSTRTYLINLNTGKILFDLEQMQVYRNGSRVENVNFNFWGVTFAPDNDQFYATLGSGSDTYLIKGSVKTQVATVLLAGIECPSMSPNGTQIAFKHRNPGVEVTWRLSVLNLRTMRSHPLAETRDVDDQAAWLNNSTVAYALAETGSASAASTSGISAISAGASLATDTWTVPANGGGRPQLLLKGSWSLISVRPQN